MTTEQPAEGIPSPSLLDPESSRHPQPGYRALRESAPVVRIEDVGVLVTTHAEVEHVLQHPEVFSSSVSAADLKNDRPLIPLQIDPPDHRKYRMLLNPLFSATRMRAMEGSIARLARDLIDGFADEGDIDFASRFSIPFPSQVTLDLLGLPQEDLPRFLAMKDGIIHPMEQTGEPPGHPATEAHQAATARSIYDYFGPALAERARAPRDDMLSFFLNARVDGERLSREEILDICFLLLIAGLDTVTASLECFFAHLCEFPERRREIVADPALVPAAVEELLRWETPVVAVPRIATCDTVLAGTEIAAGEHVMVLLGSANTDQAGLPDADQVRWDRDVTRQLAFGGGIHRCLGRHLARVELCAAVTIWHERIPDYRLAPGAALVFTPGVRSVGSFPMILGTAG
jgi:cytochrome P450